MTSVRSATVALAAVCVLSACSTARDQDSAFSAVACTTCHGAPPAQGAHARHAVAGTFSNPIACTACHPMPDVLEHASGTVDIQFSALARQDVTSPGYAGGTCAVYCHASTAALGGGISAAWTSTAPITCSGCHTLAPTSGFHTGHLGRGVQCASCHPGYSIDPPTVDLGWHVDGALESRPSNLHGAVLSSWPASCTGCHPAQPPAF